MKSNLKESIVASGYGVKQGISLTLVTAIEQ